MRSIAIMNQKGGVGKTTTAVNLSAALAATGLRVCLLDFDPQAHATLHFGIEPRPDELSIYDVLVGKVRLGEVCRQVAENLWAVPSSLDLAAAEVVLREKGTVPIRHDQPRVGAQPPGASHPLDPSPWLALRDRLGDDPPAVDYLLIDCPPSLGILTLNALAAVHEVFIPLQPHFLALHGLSKLLDTIDHVAARVNGQLKLSGVILCMYDGGTRLAAEVSEDVDAFFRNARGQLTPWANAQTFHTRIRRNIRLAEAPSFGKSIFQYAPDSHGAEDYQQLAKEVVAGGQ